MKLEDEAKTSAYVLVAPSQGRELKLAAPTAVMVLI